MSTESVVAEARRWIGTPYLHQASTLGAGADCLGLLRGVWRALYGDEPEPVPPYTGDWAEPQRDEALWEAARRHLVSQSPDGLALGDVLLFRMREGSIAKHLGILTKAEPDPAFVHAYQHHGVVESKLTEPWRRRVVARFTFPGGAD